MNKVSFVTSIGFCLKNYFRNHDFEDNVVREAELFREQEQEEQKQTLKKQPKASPPMDSGMQMDTMAQLGADASNSRLDPSSSSRGPEAMHKRSTSSQSASADVQRETLVVRADSPSAPLNVTDSDMTRHRRSTSRELPMPPFDTPSPPLA
ncbi:hypothetical protein ONZ45_g6812 [Pleurotus djamor]|nr:hypothetical protein ONZ45_g6812 [Pleurotus djamor]